MTGTLGSAGSGLESRKRRADGGLLQPKAFNNEAGEQLTAGIARMHYSSQLPFNLARNPYYTSSYTLAANHHSVGYKPPSYNALRTTLLKKERANIEIFLPPIKQTWNEKGLSIVSDG